MTTVAIVANVLAHYRVPLLNRLTQIPNLQIEALLCAESEDQRAWKSTLANTKFKWRVFPKLVIPYRTARADETSMMFSPRLWRHLARTPYDLVVTLGWTMPNTAVALFLRRMCGGRTVLWDTSIPHPAPWLKRLVSPAIRGYFGSFDGYLAVSSLCKEYMISMGARAERVVLLPQAIDNEYFVTHAHALRAERETLKQSLGLAGRRVLLYVGQFTKRKGLLPLLEAFPTILAQNQAAALLLVGSGPLKHDLLQRADALGVRDHVLICDAVKNTELPRYYACADVFVLPSFYDTYGVVVNEAMASGLPIVTTFGVGAAKDLVHENGNGFIVAPGDSAALAHALTHVLQDTTLAAAMGKESQRIISTWTVDAAAENFAKGLELFLAA